MTEIKQHIRDIKDFPKPGIVFKDITPLLNNPKLSKRCLNKLLELLENKAIDKVVGIESRGFFYATLLAQQLEAGFIPVRKKGKLPFSTLAEEYALEYGTDTLEIHADAIKKGDRILIHDDILATGGTALAVCKLVEQLGGEIIQVSFLMQLDFLKGIEKLNGYEVKSLLSY